MYRQNGITTIAEGIEFDKARQRRQEEVCYNFVYSTCIFFGSLSHLVVYSFQ